MKLGICKELSQHAMITNAQTKLAFDGRNYKTTVSFSDGSEYQSFYSGRRGKTIYVDKDVIEMIKKSFNSTTKRSRQTEQENFEEFAETSK